MNKRLIDADKLRNDFLDLPNCYNGFSDTYDKALIIDVVDEQPTVEAIPIEWVKKWCGNEPYWSNLAMQLIDDWEKENGSNS